MASVVGEREIDLSKLSIEQLNQLKTQLGEVREEEGGKEGGREGGKEGGRPLFQQLAPPQRHVCAFQGFARTIFPLYMRS